MTTYRVLDFDNPVYTAVFTYKEKEYVVQAPAVINTDNSVNLELSKASISNYILNKKAEVDAVPPSNGADLIGGTFTANEELVDIAENPEEAEGL
tara:strand:+ start:23458 stop:23742 length:285 start_codon:yes stop_codon:yes gene_type:complete